MNKLIHKLISLLLLSLLAVACNTQEAANKLEVSQGFWGHLPELSRTAPSKLYLSYVGKNESYRVCLAQYMIDKYPGIQYEIKASINLWAHYIGRKINVEILPTNISEPDPMDNETNVMNDFYTQCPQDSHLVVGEAYFADGAVGKTIPQSSYYYRNGKQVIASFKRALFLRAHEENPTDQNEFNVQWKSLAQVSGIVRNDEQIFELMKNRDKVEILTAKNEFLTLGTIMHEVGHIWGLCDQYALAENRTNCDPNFATINDKGHIVLDDSSTMSTASWFVKLFLQDDDIEGIRRLAERKQFANDWPLANEFRNIPVPEVTGGKEKVIATINSAELENSAVNLKMSVITNVAPVTVNVSAWDSRMNNWIEFSEKMINDPSEYKQYNLKINLGSGLSPKKVKVIFTHDSEKVLKLESEITRKITSRGYQIP
jgi:hypothetical protein